MLWKSGCSLILLLTTIASLDAMMEDFLEDETTTTSVVSMNSSTVSFTTMPSSERTTATAVNSSNIVKNPDEETIQDSSHASSPSSDTVWECPNITKAGVECSCDFPHTLRCTGDRTALQTISRYLRYSRPGTISLLDVTVSGISLLPARFLENIALHGLVVSTGELRRVHENAFIGLIRPLQALGLPNNLLDSVPTAALSDLIGLEKLDLSQNKLKTLEADSFKGLSNLTYLDLCDNLLSQLSPQAFASLPSLRSLRMRGNRLSVSALSALRGLKILEELDLSNNLLLGPMGPNLLPQMPRLRLLTVSENELINVQQGALVGLRNLTYLSLSHNQIDVLEDHSFKYLSTLTRLDLANNRIVAVSSSSLAHLEKLTILDLTHNFLRSLTADLVVPLKSLQDLRLDDNDITMVSSDVPTSKLRLKRLSLADNPLNCDCTLLEFANWLSNSSLNEEDKSSAVCATPPALENGILTQVSPGSLLCGEPTPPIMTRVPLAGAQLTLKEFHYDKSTGINLLWHVEPCTERYTCDTLIVYETVGDSEVQTDSSSLHCDSRMMRNPCSLPVAIPASLHLQPGHKYRYCVVLLVPSTYEEVSLGLGCSDVITLEETKRDLQQDQQTTISKLPSSTSDTKITGVHVNVSDQGFLHVDVSLSNSKKSNIPECELSVVVFDAESAVHKQKLNCTLTFVTLAVLLPGRYKVCASLDEVNEDDVIANFVDDRDRLRCVEVQGFKQNTEIIVLAIIGAGCALLITLAVIGRSVIKRVKHPRIQTQCFLPAQEFEITHKAHYIKLLATTKV
uniref:vasorin-like n=1 Tax=Osmia lignaria TaxID=473952 RepID=UPI00147831DC|nr:vasorin-like [Osmia lignaria]XP_034195271.1 vasorin-like isoform X2 [Osmia lignaria]XP_034195272.1 vasorin-like isoform X2 [Osmia lignaria]XP_034195273.1 vasorin-like isoform X2 [Osmia lignaria]XP_034195274.1 vasorin-like isoform X2 [Osmia lignaria]XP_034195283.1 vasorin-like [Osmia lignaria]